MITVPDNFTEFGDSIMSNLDHEINQDVAKKIKGKPYYAGYAAYSFYGKVWWHKRFWHCHIMRYGSHVETISAKTLEAIMKKASFIYGAD